MQGAVVPHRPMHAFARVFLDMGPGGRVYHGRSDEVVPFAHLELYAAAIPQATIRRLDGRNHQLNDDLSEVASDIERLSN